MKEQTVNAYEELRMYLSNEHGIDTEQNQYDEEDDYFDRQLKELILQYGQEQRKEGYKKGFEDGEADSDDYIPFEGSRGAR